MALTLAATACGDKKVDKPAVRKDGVVETKVPGEATLSLVGQKIRTKITGASLRKKTSSAGQFTEAVKGHMFLTFKVEVANVGSKETPLGGGYSLKLPDGKIVEYSGVADGEDVISFGDPLAAGEKKAGTLSWEVPTPKNGSRYIFIWKPNPSGKEQARFGYEHKGS